MKAIIHNKYKPLGKNEQPIYRYPQTNHTIPKYVYTGASPNSDVYWEIKAKASEVDPFEIHELLLESFGDIIETRLQRGQINEKYLYQHLVISYNFNVILPSADASLKRFSSPGCYLQIKKNPRKKGGRIMYLSNMFTVYADYPRNKTTGKLLDFTAFAPQNREAFNSGFAKLLKGIDGQVIDWYPKIGIYPNPKAKQIYKNQLDWLAEETDNSGFTSLSERKEEYEKQQSEPPKSPGFFARLFNRIKLSKTI